MKLQSLWSLGARGILLIWLMNAGVGCENAASRAYPRIQRNARRHDTPVDIRTELSTDARVHSQPSAPCSANKQIVVGSRSFSASLITTSGSSRAFSQEKAEMP